MRYQFEPPHERLRPRAISASPVCRSLCGLQDLSRSFAHTLNSTLLSKTGSVHPAKESESNVGRHCDGAVVLGWIAKTAIANISRTRALFSVCLKHIAIPLLAFGIPGFAPDEQLLGTQPKRRSNEQHQENRRQEPFISSLPREIAFVPTPNPARCSRFLRSGTRRCRFGEQRVDGETAQSPFNRRTRAPFDCDFQKRSRLTSRFGTQSECNPALRKHSIQDLWSPPFRGVHSTSGCCNH